MQALKLINSKVIDFEGDSYTSEDLFTDFVKEIIFELNLPKNKNILEFIGYLMNNRLDSCPIY